MATLTLDGYFQGDNELGKFVYAKVQEDGSVKSSVDKFYTPEQLAVLKEKMGANPGDLILILSGDDVMKTRKQFYQ